MLILVLINKNPSSICCPSFEPVCEMVNIGDGNRECRVSLSPQRRWDRLTKMDTHSGSPVSAECQAVIDH